MSSWVRTLHSKPRACATRTRAEVRRTEPSVRRDTTNCISVCLCTITKSGRTRVRWPSSTHSNQGQQSCISRMRGSAQYNNQFSYFSSVLKATDTPRSGSRQRNTPLGKSRYLRARPPYESARLDHIVAFPFRAPVKIRMPTHAGNRSTYSCRGNKGEISVAALRFRKRAGDAKRGIYGHAPILTIGDQGTRLDASPSKNDNLAVRRPSVSAPGRFPLPGQSSTFVRAASSSPA